MKGSTILLTVVCVIGAVTSQTFSQFYVNKAEKLTNLNSAYPT